MAIVDEYLTAAARLTLLIVKYMYYYTNKPDSDGTHEFFESLLASFALLCFFLLSPPCLKHFARASFALARVLYLRAKFFLHSMLAHAIERPTSQ